MKLSSIFATFACVAGIFFSPLLADKATSSPCGCKNEVLFCEKTYVASDQIGFLGNKILINLEGVIIHVPEVCSDHGGLYFRSFYIGQDCGTGMIPCPYSDCNECNAFWRKKCTRCDRKIR